MTWSDLFGAAIVDVATLLFLVVHGGPLGAMVAAAYVPAWLMWVILGGSLAVVGLMAACLSTTRPAPGGRE